MILDEKGLCRAMKECYKGSGYEVAMVSGYDLELATRTECDEATGEVQEAEEDRYIIMSGPNWMTWCFLPEVPRKVLGLIVEHMGSIPMEDHAYRVMKSNTQEEMTDLLVNAYIRHKGGEKWTAKRTMLTLGQCEIWQDDRQKIHLVKQKDIELIRENAADFGGTVDAEGVHCFESVGSGAYIWSELEPEALEEKMRHLEGIQWT